MKCYYSINNEQFGPISLEELQEINIDNQTLIWHDGLSDWENAIDIPELSNYFKSKVTPPPLPQKKQRKPPPLTPGILKSSSNGRLELDAILENFKNDFTKKNIYHSQKNFYNNIKTQIAYIKEFKLKLAATQFNTFIIIGVSESEITEELIRDFKDETFNFAKKHTAGLPRGMQSCLSVIAVLVANKASFNAKNYCLKLSKNIATIKIPIVVELDTKEVIHYKGTPMWGWLFHPYFKRLISENVKSVLSNIN